MTVRNARTGRALRLSAPTQFMARQRTLVELAWPGEVVGIPDRGTLRIGDTLSESGDIVFPGIPRFSPEHFARVWLSDSLRRKHLDTGLRQLSEEGAVQLLYQEALSGATPIVGAVGQLQFDVLLNRLSNEYGVEARLEKLHYVAARWVVGPERSLERGVTVYGGARVYDTAGRPLLLFADAWSLRRMIEETKDTAFYDVSP